jgi:long-subunit fatty acid transport protein
MTLRWSKLTLLAVLVCPKAAPASSAAEYPDNGAAQFSRGGAWLANASDPIAAYYNPAALALQPTSASAGLSLAFQRICLRRRGPSDRDASYSAVGEPYPEVCNENAGRPNPLFNAAVGFRVSERLGIGLSVVPPSSFGKTEWPASVEVTDASGQIRRIPSPQRYLSLGSEGTVYFLTLGAGYAIAQDLRIGAGFVAGAAWIEIDYASLGRADPAQLRTGDDASSDRRQHLQARDLFIPGFVASVDYSATRNVDVAAWYRFSDSLRARGDLDVWAPLYGTPPANPVLPECSGGMASGCAALTRARDRLGTDPLELEIPIAMEARLGIRWHLPQPAATGLLAERIGQPRHATRDPLRDEVCDIEIDLTWANNSAADVSEVRLPRALSVAGSEGVVPANQDVDRTYDDSFGARLGGQYALIRNEFAVRAGTWIETPAASSEDLDVTAVPSFRGGVALGLVFRVQSVDLELGYQHAYNTGLDNDGDGRRRAIAGASSEPTFDFRSYHAVNGGSVTQSANVFALGAVTRF